MAAGDTVLWRRWLSGTLCVILGVTAALSDLLSEFLPDWLASLLIFTSFLGFVSALLYRVRRAGNVVEAFKLLVPALLAVILVTYGLLLPLLYLYQDDIANRTSFFFDPWPLPASTVRSYISPRVEELAIAAGEDVRLQGWLVNNSREAKAPLVIYFGGSGASSTEVLPYAQQLDGWSVAVMSYRGFGLSTGTPTHATSLSDAVRIYDTLAARPDVDSGRIVTMGYSLGTGVAVYLASQRPVAAIILVAPFDNITLTGVRRPLLALPLRPVMKRYFDSAARAHTIRAPLLCLVGLRDKQVPPDLALRLMGHWSGDTEVRVYPSEDHDLLFHDNRSWDDIASFLATIASESRRSS